MKKSVLFIALIFLFLAVFPLISASTNSTVADKGFACLQNKTIGQCGNLTLGQQIFTSLATGLCTNNVENASLNITPTENCWGSNGVSCDIKTTAEAMLALNARGVSLNNSKSWLISQNHTTSSIIWYLQLDSNKPMTCTITYPSSSTNSNSATININSNKQIQQSSAGTCFIKSDNGYWLSLNNQDPSCFGETFKVSCNETFTATKLYQQSPIVSNPTIYVSPNSQIASSGASIKESFSSYCFGSQGGTAGTCNYEDTLWASLILNKLGYGVNPYLPYLTTQAGDPANGPNSQYLPYAFLYSITQSPDSLTNLLASEKSVNGNKYWEYSQDSYFGTSLALLALGSSDASDFNSAVSWLSDQQGSDGCWGTIPDTAFVLYSAFGPKNLASPTTQSVSPQICSNVGYCLSSSVCTNEANGTVLSNDYSASCPPLQICCSQNYQQQSCLDQGGQFCSSGTVCNVSTVSSSDSTSGNLCCPSTGTCVTTSTPTTNTCTSLKGICQDSCSTNEVQLSGTCTNSQQICCGSNGASNDVQSSSNSNLIWIILLSILIVLSLLGIIFRKKITEWWKKMKLHGKGNNRGPPGPGFGPRPFPPRGPPPSFPGRPMMRPGPRQGRPAPKSSKEVNDVLKKLKDMGK